MVKDMAAQQMICFCARYGAGYDCKCENRNALPEWIYKKGSAVSTQTTPAAEKYRNGIGIEPYIFQIHGSNAAALDQCRNMSEEYRQLICFDWMNYFYLPLDEFLEEMIES